MLLVITIVMSNYFFSTISQNSNITTIFPTTDSVSLSHHQLVSNSQLLNMQNNISDLNRVPDSPIVDAVISYDDFRQESQNTLYRETDSSVVRETDNVVNREPVLSQEMFRMEAKRVLYREAE